jgi:hypothetical protein
MNSSSFPINGMLQLLGDTQLKYRRLHLSDYARELAPRPATVSLKVQLPLFFTTLFQDLSSDHPIQQSRSQSSGSRVSPVTITVPALTVMSVSGKKYSLWHSLLYVLLPDFINKSWYERKNIVDKFIDELNHKVTTHFRNDTLVKMDAGLVKFHDLLPSNELLYYLASLFDINIIVVDTVSINFIFKGVDFQSELPTILLHQDDTPIFHVITINDKSIFSSNDPDDAINLYKLYESAPKINPILSQNIKLTATISAKDKKDELFCDNIQKQHLDTYAKINKLTDAKKFELEVTPSLQKLKLGELQALAVQFGLSATKQGKTKQVNLTKKEILALIIAHNAK